MGGYSRYIYMYFVKKTKPVDDVVGLKVIVILSKGIDQRLRHLGNHVILSQVLNLKGLSHEIDFKNFDKKLHNLA